MSSSPEFRWERYLDLADELAPGQAAVVVKNGEGGYGPWRYGEPLIALQTVPILAHLQWYRVFSTLWDLEEVEAAMIKVSFVAWSSTAPDPIPALITYGSLIDEVSDDPTTVMGAFADPYDIDCMWNGGGTPVTPKPGRISRRPAEIAPR